MDFGIFAAGLTSLALGAAMTVFGWSALRQNRRREAARTALLSQLAFPGGIPGDAVTDSPADAGGLSGVDEFRSESSVAAETLFSEPEPSGAASRRTMALTVIFVAFATVIGTYKWFAGAESGAKIDAKIETSARSESDAVTSGTIVSVPPPVQPAPRVELLSLSHRVTAEAFVVTGQVRNPASGAALDEIVAVVGVMDRAGRVLMTVRAPLKQRALNAGEVSDFSAVALKAINVAQYRVEFQNSARAVIPHSDRRKQE